MKKFKHVLASALVVLFIYTIINSISTANSITAASCSRVNVQTAINSASAGDTVIVPAGTCSWSGGLSISGIQLIGAGKSTSGTVITAGKVTMTKHSSQYTRVSGFRFTGTDEHIYAGGSASAKPYIIDNNYIRSDVSVSEGRAVHLSANGGLLHHNDFFAVNWTNADVMNIQTSENWSQAPTFGNTDTTGERNIYFEDNVFTNIAETMPDGDVGSRLVIRYNRYKDSSIVFHGGAPSDSSPGGGTRQFEVYNNIFDRVSNSVPINKWIWVRGSSGVIANNTFEKADSPDNSTYPNKSEIRLTLACASSYPMQYQVGQSNQIAQNPPTRPLLIFGNSGAGTSDGNFITIGSSNTAGGTCSSPNNYIKPGRDYTLSNSWGWVPYTYPHPLQTLGGVIPPALDTTSPTISMTSPAIGATVSGTAMISANASDNVAVAGVQFILDGKNLLAEDITAPYSVPWDTTTATNATHSITAIARDTSNNTAVVVALIVTVNNAVVPPPPDTTSPVVSITSPILGSTVSGTVPIIANATDNIGVVGVQFKVDGVNLNNEDSSSPYSTNWNTNTTINGPHTLTAVARDVANNTGTVVAVNVSVNNVVAPPLDIVSPIVTLTSPLVGATLTGTVALNANASDNIAVAGVQFKLDGVNLGLEDTSSPYSVSWNTTTATNGPHNLIAVARDTSNNTASVIAVNVTVSNTAPTTFAIGSRVIALQNVAARNTPSTSGTILQIHTTGELGTIIGGSTIANGWTWWNINYDIGTDGWSTQQGYLSLTTTPSPAPTPTPPPPTPTPTPPTPPGGPAALPQGNTGIAAQYPGDVNIQSDPSVLFTDDFESYTSPSQLTTKWNNYYQSGNTRIATEAANVFAGTKSLEFTLPTSSSEVANAVTKNISPTQDTLFVRVYTKFDPLYNITTDSNHNGIRISSKYPGPGSPPNGSDFFLFIFENAKFKNETTPGYSHLYVYHPEQRSQWGDIWYPNGEIIPNNQTPIGNFGQYFVPRANFIPQRDRWYSYELMVKANTPGQRDGRAAYWIDGVLMADFQNIRVRDITSLKIDHIELELHAQAGGSSRPNKKWYDNLVVAKSYIGPVQ